MFPNSSLLTTPIQICNWFFWPSICSCLSFDLPKGFWRESIRNVSKVESCSRSGGCLSIGWLLETWAYLPGIGRHSDGCCFIWSTIRLLYYAACCCLPYTPMYIPDLNTFIVRNIARCNCTCFKLNHKM